MKKYYHVSFIEMNDMEARVQRTVTCENGLANMESSPYVDVLDYERAYPGDDPMVDMYIEVEKVNGEEVLDVMEDKLLDWKEAEEHFYFVKNLYEEIPEGKLALIMFLNPVAARYEKGERTEELYQEMMSVE